MMFGWRRKLDAQPYSVIDRETEVHGPIRSSGTLEVRGHVRGPVTHDGKLIIAPGGVCFGTVRSVDLYLQGEIHGNVTVTGTLRIGNGGVLFGDAECRRLVIDPGGCFVGINRSEADARPAGADSAAAPAYTPRRGPEAPGAQMPVAAPVVEPAVQSAREPAVESTWEPVREPAGKPAGEPTRGAVEKAAWGPDQEPAGEPGQAGTIVFHGYMRSRRRLAPVAPESDE